MQVAKKTTPPRHSCQCFSRSARGQKKVDIYGKSSSSKTTAKTIRLSLSLSIKYKSKKNCSQGRRRLGKMSSLFSSPILWMEQNHLSALTPPSPVAGGPLSLVLQMSCFFLLWPPVSNSSSCLPFAARNLWHFYLRRSSQVKGRKVLFFLLR